MSIRLKQKKIPIVIDTDFGGDPDDAIALIYALHSPELDIRAIITSDEYHTNHRALLLKQWLVRGGYDILVFSGHDLGNSNLFLLDDLIQGSEEVNSIFKGNTIKTVLTELAISKGHYLSIGGLSNLRYLHDSFPKLWKSINTTIMGGAIHYHREGAIEHNIGLDIESARAIFENEERNRWVLSDHTFAIELSVKNSHKLYSHFTARNDFFYSLVRTNMDRFFTAFYSDSRMHDSLTLSSLFLPTVKFSAEKMIMNSKGEFVSIPTGKLVEISTSADYSLFWSDIYAKLHD
ncbi:MAG: nucleoside hydrolase [Candidatus Paceibacterota bacterium]